VVGRDHDYRLVPQARGPHAAHQATQHPVGVLRLQHVPLESLGREPRVGAQGVEAGGAGVALERVVVAAT
jgi:hypothetical protein